MRILLVEDEPDAAQALASFVVRLPRLARSGSRERMA
jgi:hypothetical protein